MKMTVSSLARAEKCPSSSWLPSVKEDAGEWSARGTALHAYFAAVSQGKSATEVQKSLPVWLRSEAFTLDVSFFEGGNFAAEVAFAYDVRQDTARELHRGLGNRDYSKATADELCGTADLVGVTDDAVVIWDVKTGHADQGAPEDSLQLLAYAVAAARTYGKRQAQVGFLLLIDGRLVPQAAVLDEVALDAAAARIQRLLFAASKKNAEAVFGVGEHCKHCPSFRLCPAQQGLARELIALPQAELTPSNAAAVYKRLKDVERVLDVVRKSLRTYAEIEPIDLGGGKQYSLQRRKSTTIDAVKAVEAMPELAEVVETKLTQAAIKRMPLLDAKEVEATLRAAGAWIESEHCEVREHKVKGGGGDV